MRSKKFLSVLFLAAVIFSALSVSASAALRGDVVWSFQTKGVITTGIAVSGNLVLAGDELGNFYAVNKNTGRSAWSYNGSHSFVGTPAVADGKVVVAEADGTVSCLKLNDGSVVWSREVDVEGMGLTLVDGAAIGDGKVYVARGDAMLNALSFADGHSVWDYKSEGTELRTAPAFGEEFVMLGEQNAKFSMINPKTGKRVNGGGAGGAVNTPVINNGNVYFSSWDGSVQRVQINGVIPKWHRKFGNPITTMPIVGGSRVFIGTANGVAAALSVEGGNILWNYDTEGGNITANPVFTGNSVIIISGQGALLELDAATGRPNKNLKLNAGGVTPAFSAEDGVLFISGSSQSIDAVR